MTPVARQVGGAPCLRDFLAADFARINAGVIARCGKVDGKRLFISGATGFFGKNLLALLAYLHGRGAKFEVTALSRAPDRFLADQPWCRGLPWLQWHKGDASEAWPGEGRYDLVLHAATDTVASAHVDKLAVFEGILAGTRQALAFAAAHGVRRLLLCGSGAEYGAIPENYRGGIPESSSLSCTATQTTSAYGEAKRAAEILAALHAEKHGFEVVNTRCFAFVGPGLPLDGHFAIGNFLRAALANEPIKLATQGAATRSYLYGADLAVWLVVLLLEAAAGSLLNVGSGQGIRIIDLATRVRDLVNPRLAVLPGSRSADEERHLYLPCIQRAQALGLDAWTGLDEAITRTAAWHRLGDASTGHARDRIV
jgi:nucleoside-diphosphate-sugar epimerase